MKHHARRLLTLLSDTFFIVPAAFVMSGIVGALLAVALDRSGAVPPAFIASSWIYSGGATGARTLLGAVVSSTIGVAGTVFSITIAALSLAAGQMGPRLLRNFTRDRGNQVTLGIFLGTFCYALMVLRTVRTAGEGEFVPHVALTLAILLAFLCVGTLVFFVGHMAGRINVETVVDLVSEDVQQALQRFTTTGAEPAKPLPVSWQDASPVIDDRHGYLQELDQDALADWATVNGAAIRLLVRPGDYVFPGVPVALVTRSPEGSAPTIRAALALGPQRVSASDVEYAVRQLVEVGVRALSPGINDPHTAISVLDRLGAALCGLAGRHLPDGHVLRDGRLALSVPPITYDGLSDAMFNMIRQNSAGSVAVLIRVMEVLTAVASCERGERLVSLTRHANLVLGDGERSIPTPADLQDLRERHLRFMDVRRHRGSNCVAPHGKAEAL